MLPEEFALSFGTNGNHMVSFSASIVPPAFT